MEAAFPYSLHEPADATAPTASPGSSFYNGELRPLVPASNAVTHELELGRPMGLLVRLTPGFYAPDNGLIPYSSLFIPNRYHAVLAMGSGRTATGDSFFLVRNSWGRGWGVDGYGWLPAQYVDVHAIEAFGA